MNISRRSFIGASAGVTAGLLLPSTSFGQNDSGNPELASEDRVFELLSRALEAATSLGASYSETSVTRDIQENLGNTQSYITGGGERSSELLSFGVRVLIDGRWGFASSGRWDSEEAVRLARAAVSQARANARIKPRSVDWETIPGESGRFVMPGIDPFSVPLEEKLDLLNSWRSLVLGYDDPVCNASLTESTTLSCSRREHGYMNSHNCRQLQISYRTDGRFGLVGIYKKQQSLSQPQPALCEGTHHQRAGWEAIRNANVHEQIPFLVEKSAKTALIGASPLDVGRYEIVCDAETSARLLLESLVKATQLDRVIGYEANATGTSYLGPDPLASIGTPVAHPTVTIRGNRTSTTGLATVKWDSDGIAAQEFDLVRDGVLVNYQSNRDLAPMLNPWFSQNGEQGGSTGCAAAASSDCFPIIGIPNITIDPASDETSESAMISGIKKGYYLMSAGVRTSFQCQDGIGISRAREIINGRLGNYVSLGILFNTTELWKSVIGRGDASTRQSVPLQQAKGQPRQQFASTIDAVPLGFENVAVIDPMKRA